MKSLSRTLRFCSLLAVGVLAIFPGSQRLAAQYYPGTQYPAQQPAYPQPSYPQQAAYPQQYAQPGYPQPYAQPQYPQQPAYAPPSAYAPQAMSPAAAPLQQPMSPDDLAQLVAPVALYPDALLAQILAGATYPAQLAAADQWVHTLGFANPDQVAAAASTQTMWDPSVKALTAYPQVLDMLAGNLQWTTVLGNAYYNQPQDVLQTVQVMRGRAEQAGTLVNSPQMEVVQQPGYIALQPVNPDVVYVPTYNPWAVYGAPIRPYSGFSFCGILSTLANTFLGGGFGRGGFGRGGFGSGFGAGGGGLQFLASFALGAFNRTPFGMIAWGLDWLVNALTFHHNNYFTASATVRDWGLPYGGPRYHPRAFSGSGGYGDGYRHEAIAIHQDNRAIARASYNSGFNRGPDRGMDRGMDRGQQVAMNRSAESAFRAPVNNGFASRAASPQPVRPGSTMMPDRGGQFGGMQPARQSYQVPQNSYRDAYAGNSFGNGSNRGGNMAYNSPAPKQGGFHPFGGGNKQDSFGGGGSYKEPKFKEPKEPKMSEPKMAKMKAPKESSHGGGHHR